MLVSLDFFKSIIGKIIDDVKRMKIDIDELQPKINGSPGQIVGFDTNGKLIATEESDPSVPDWAKQPQKPAYTAQEVGALPATTAIPSTAADVNAEPYGAVSQHNVSDASHSDIRLLISGLTDRLNALADSDDTTLDQLSEVVEYIKANRELIASITTDKVSVADIVDNLTTNVANKPLSAAQGVALKALIDELTEAMPEAYNLPIASSTVLGGVQPTAKAETMTQAVGVDEAGALWTAAGGTSDHSKLANRDAADQHPMSAITGLEKALEGKQPTGNYLTDKDLDTTITVKGKAADAKAVGDALRSLSEEIANIPSGKDGVTFTPSVSETGIISWTNDGGLENPASVDIRGPAGSLSIGGGLKWAADGKLTVDTADKVEQDNTLPITSAAVHTTVGNIEILLKTI